MLFIFFKEHNYISLNQQRTNKTITFMFALRDHSKINGPNQLQSTRNTLFKNCVSGYSDRTSLCNVGESALRLNWSRKKFIFQDFSLIESDIMYFKGKMTTGEMVGIFSPWQVSCSLCSPRWSSQLVQRQSQGDFVKTDNEGTGRKVEFSTGACQEGSDLHSLLPSLAILWFGILQKQEAKGHYKW